MMFVSKSKYFEMVSRLNNEIRGLKLKLADEKGKMTRVTTLSQEHFFDKDKSILIFFKDKQEALFYCIVDIKDNTINLKIYEFEINFTTHYIAMLDAQIKNSIMKIYDIQMMDNFINRGLGSFLIQVLKTVAKQRNIKKITGDLSVVDLDGHKDRLLHFYKKHGFSIEKYSGPEKCIQYLIKCKILSFMNEKI